MQINRMCLIFQMFLIFGGLLFSGVCWAKKDQKAHGVHAEFSTLTTRWTGKEVLDSWSDFSLLRLGYAYQLSNHMVLRGGSLVSLSVQNDQKLAEFQNVNSEGKLLGQKDIHVNMQSGWFLEWVHAQNLIKEIQWYFGAGLELLTFEESQFFQNSDGSLDTRGSVSINMWTPQFLLSLQAPLGDSMELGLTLRAYFPQSEFIKNSDPTKAVGKTFVPFDRVTLMPSPASALYWQYWF